MTNDADQRDLIWQFWLIGCVVLVITAWCVQAAWYGSRRAEMPPTTAEHGPPDSATIYTPRALP